MIAQLPSTTNLLEHQKRATRVGATTLCAIVCRVMGLLCGEGAKLLSANVFAEGAVKRRKPCVTYPQNQLVHAGYVELTIKHLSV